MRDAKCFCLRQEMPRDISVIGYVEDEVLFSFFILPKTKIERLPPLSIFSFVCAVQTLASDTLCKSCGSSSCAVRYSCRDMDSHPPQQARTSPHFALKLPAPSGQNTLLYRGIDGCQWLPLLLGNISSNEGLWWNVYNVGTISNRQGETTLRGVINTSFVCWTRTLKPHRLQLPRVYGPWSFFAVRQLLM